MTLWHALLLGILQGITEFLPVSSSGHLVLVPWLLGWPAPGLAFDTIVHWGTAVAVIAYFARDLVAIVRDWVLHLLRRQEMTENARLGWLLILATIPGALIGAVGENTFEALFGAPAWAAGFLLVTALILAISEKLGQRTRGEDSLRWWEALLIGLAQGVAIAPGISRSGATIAMGLVLGLRRPAAARFSFLLSIPTILGAGVLQLFSYFSAPAGTAAPVDLAVGFLAAAVSGYLAISFLLSFVRRQKLYPFAVYCAVAGTFGLIMAFIR